MDHNARPAWSVRLAIERERRGWNKHEMARRLLAAAGTEYPPVKSLAHQVRRWERGEHFPRDWMSAYAAALDTTEEELFGSEPSRAGGVLLDLAVAYPRTLPGELLRPIRRHLAYVGTLLDARKTLAEHRRLLTIGGWLSLLGATCDIDLYRRASAEARLRTAAGLADETRHAEIAAWCLETRAWWALTDGDLREAVRLSQGAQTLAPRGGSAYIQATAQEGRAWARLAPPGRRTNSSTESPH